MHFLCVETMWVIFIELKRVGEKVVAQFLIKVVMLTFLRRLRKRFIENHSARNYTLYAIGEIALVVIGILIALQINNWNENRKQLTKEINTVQELYVELNQNLEFTQGEIELSQERMSDIKRLLQLTASDSPNITYKNFNHLLNSASGYKEYTPIINKVTKILSVDDLVFTKSGYLDELLSDYFSSVEQVTRYFEYNVDTWKLVNGPFLVENYTLRNFNWLPPDVETSRHNVDHIAMLKDRKFENVIASLCADVKGYLERLVISKELILSLQQMIERDYPIERNSN